MIESSKTDRLIAAIRRVEAVTTDLDFYTKELALSYEDLRKLGVTAVHKSSICDDRICLNDAKVFLADLILKKGG